MKTERYTAQQVIDAIEEGMTAVGAARILGCKHMTVLNYAKRYPTVDAVLKAKRREMVGLAEMGLRRAILAGESWAIAFALKTLGKDDGYTERQEIAGPDGEAILIRVDR